LIYFIHHASTIIQASNVIQNVSEDLHLAIKRLFPEKIGHGEPEHRQGFAEIPSSFATEALPIRSNSTGYLQAIDDQELMKIACKYNLLIHLQVRPGKFLLQGSDLVLVFPGEKVNKKLTKQINDAFISGKERTEQQDVEFPIYQLVEIALRAISPGINDPFTAIRCIDRITAGLCHLAQRNFPSPYRYDDNNKLRFIVEGADFKGLLDCAFNQIRQYGKSDAEVTMRLLEAIATISTYTNNSQYQASLRHHAQMILQDSRVGLSQNQDYKDIEQRYDEIINNLNDYDSHKNWD
jgi:uncharacterized membrane protein